jgi:hypothetical protein
MDIKSRTDLQANTKSAPREDTVKDAVPVDVPWTSTLGIWSSLGVQVRVTALVLAIDKARAPAGKTIWRSRFVQNPRQLFRYAQVPQ